MAGSAKVTTDHDEIRRWVEERGGCPARVKGTGKGDDPGLIRIDYTGFSGKDTLEKISWDEWFRAFDRNGLAFLHQDRKNGRISRFSKLVSRERVNVEGQGKESRGDGQQARKQERRAGERRQQARKQERPAGEQERRASGHERRVGEQERRAGEQERRAGEQERRARPIDAITLLTQQHQLVRELLGSVEDRSPAMMELLDNLSIHVEIEELVFYPMLRDIGMAEQMLESVEDHLVVKRIIADLVDDDIPLDEETRAAKLRILAREVNEHIDREERQIFPAVKRKLDDDQLVTLGQQMVDQMMSLLEEGEQAPLEQVLSQTAPV